MPYVPPPYRGGRGDPIGDFYDDIYDGTWSMAQLHAYKMAFASDRLLRLTDAHEKIHNDAGEKIYPKQTWRDEIADWLKQLEELKTVTHNNILDLNTVYMKIETRLGIVEGFGSEFWYDLSPADKLESATREKEIREAIIDAIIARKLCRWLKIWEDYDLPPHLPLPRRPVEKRIPRRDKKLEVQLKKMVKCDHYLCKIKLSVMRSMVAGRKRKEAQNLKKWAAKEQRAIQHKKRMEEAKIRREEARRLAEEEVNKAEEEKLKEAEESQQNGAQESQNKKSKNRQTAGVSSLEDKSVNGIQNSENKKELQLRGGEETH